MKKERILLLAIIAIVISFVFITCSKTEINKTDLLKPSYDWTDTVIRVEAIDGTSFMAFEDVEVWESIQEYLGTFSDSMLDVWNGLYSFQSMRQVYANDTLDLMPIEDPYVATCVNEAGLIQIVDKLYKINVGQNLIYILNEINEDNFGRLMNEEVVEGLIDTFNLSVPVLIPENELRKSGDIYRTMGCGEHGALRKKVSDDDAWHSNQDYSNYVVSIKSVYQPVGIYFSIILKIQHRQKGGGVNSAKTYLDITNVGNWEYKPICKNQMLSTGNKSLSNSYEVHLRPYEKIRPLYDFYFDTRYTWERKDSPGNYYSWDLLLEN